jgi:AcrR family transcriptional regulator
MFSERGYDRTSVAEIERAAGLTPGAGGLFHHFRSKEEVLREGIARHLDRLEALRRIRGAVPDLGDLRAELTLFGRYLLSEMSEESELLRVLLTEARHRPELASAGVDQIVRATFQVFADWLTARARPKGDAEATAAVALGAIASYGAAAALLDRRTMDIDEDQFVATWVEMVASFLERAPSKQQ